MQNYYWDTLTAGKKWLWILLIIFTFPVGLIVYFLIADNGAEKFDNLQSAAIQPQIVFNVPLYGGYDRGIYFCPNCGSKANLENQVTLIGEDLMCGKCG